MEVREELKEIIERARAAAEAAGEGIRRLFHECGHAVGKDGT